MTKFSELTDQQKAALTVFVQNYLIMADRLNKLNDGEELTIGDIFNDPEIKLNLNAKQFEGDNPWLIALRDQISDVKIKKVYDSNNDSEGKNLKSGLVACEFEDSIGDILFVPLGTEHFTKNYKQFLGLEEESIDQLDNIMSLIEGDSNQDQEFTCFVIDEMENNLSHNKDIKFHFIGSSKGGLVVQNAIATMYNDFKDNIGTFTCFNTPTMRYTDIANRENFVAALNTPGTARFISSNDDFVSRIVIHETYKDMKDANVIIHAKCREGKVGIGRLHSLSRLDFSNGGNVTDVKNYKKYSPKISMALGNVSTGMVNKVIKDDHLYKRVRTAFAESAPWYGKIIVRRPGSRTIYASRDALNKFKAFDDDTKRSFSESDFNSVDEYIEMQEKRQSSMTKHS